MNKPSNMSEMSDINIPNSMNKNKWSGAKFGSLEDSVENFPNNHQYKDDSYINNLRNSPTKSPNDKKSKSPKLANNTKTTSLEFSNNMYQFSIGMKMPSIDQYISKPEPIKFMDVPNKKIVDSDEEIEDLEYLKTDKESNPELSKVEFNNTDAELLSQINNNMNKIECPVTLQNQSQNKITSDNSNSLIQNPKDNSGIMEIPHSKSQNNAQMQNLKEKEIINDKIKEINYEITKLKSENEKVSKLKNEYEKLTQKLNIELCSFYDKKNKEMKEFENWKEDEVRKIQKEKKTLEKNTKSSSNLNSVPSNKKDKEEIETLKGIIVKIQDDQKIKDQTNKLMIERLKKQLEEANSKISEFNKLVPSNAILTKPSNTNLNINPREGVQTLSSIRSAKKLIENDSKRTPESNKVSNNQKLEKNKSKGKLSLPNNYTFRSTNEEIPDNNADLNYDLVFPEKYNTQSKLIKQEKTSDGKLIKIYENDKKEVVFSSGVRKEIHPDGYQIVFFVNKDIKQVKFNN